jgi:Peptidase family S41
MNSLRKFFSPVICMSLLAGPMLPAGTLAAGRPDERAANAEASLPPGVMGKTIEPDKLVVDFRLARQALEEGHSGIYRYTAKQELDDLFDLAEKSLIRPMNAVEFYRILAPVVAAIKCGHTGVGLPEEMQKAFSTKALLLPLQIRVLAGKVYILRDFSGGATTLAGREIRSINGVPAAKIVQTMLATTPGDGDSQTCRISRMSGWTLARRLPALLGVKSPYEVTVWDAKENREATVHLDGKELPRLQEAARAKFPEDQRDETAGEFKLKDGGKIAVMKINGFGGFVDTARKKSLREFYRESFEAMNERGTKSLILDLRDNGGGEDELGKLLLSYLLDEPFKYYDDLVINARQFTFQKYTDHTEPLPANLLEVQPDGKYRMVKHPNWGMQQPSKPPFHGKVLILINGGSFSTTSEFLSHAHFHKRATFIGEESGGGYYGNTSGPSLRLTLPHSNVQVRVPLMTYYMAVSGYQAKAHGVLPDCPVEYTIEELLAGKDKELALAFELARKS